MSESAVGTIASLEHALSGIEDRLRERETDLTQSRRQSVDLAEQLDQPFEHEEKLAAATKRQQEVITALDITKNQSSSNVDDSVLEVPRVQRSCRCTRRELLSCPIRSAHAGRKKRFCAQ